MTEKRGEPFEVRVDTGSVWRPGVMQPIPNGRYLMIRMLEGERLGEFEFYDHEGGPRWLLTLTREPAHQERREDRRVNILGITPTIRRIPDLCRRKQGERREG